MCFEPLKIRDTTHVSSYKYLTVPCGKCLECRTTRASQWMFRLLQEEKVSSSSCFVTLTYADNELTYNGDGEPVLYKPDLQNFFKRLRKRVRAKVKYYACGEYGTDSLRPHYHAIIFNAPDPAIIASWTQGQVFFGDVTPASIRYVVSYMQKSSLPVGDNRPPEFSHMSKKLGISYVLNSEVESYHLQNGGIDYCTLPGGDVVSMPRYYRLKLFDEQTRAALAIKHAQKYEADEKVLIQHYGSPLDYEIKKINGQQQRVAARNFKNKNRKL